MNNNYVRSLTNLIGLGILPSVLLYNFLDYAYGPMFLQNLVLFLSFVTIIITAYIVMFYIQLLRYRTLSIAMFLTRLEDFVKLTLPLAGVIPRLNIFMFVYAVTVENMRWIDYPLFFAFVSIVFYISAATIVGLIFIKLDDIVHKALNTNSTVNEEDLEKMAKDNFIKLYEMVISSIIILAISLLMCYVLIKILELID